ncbi:MAG: FG-GAP-like repeat-containing protein [Myxococcota bacterium]
MSSAAGCRCICPASRRATVLLSAAVLLTTLRSLPAHAGELRGWPVRLESGITASNPAVGDIDGDGRLEVVVGAGQSLHAVRANGGMVDGWPVKLAGEKTTRNEFPASPTLCDLDGNGALEVAALGLDHKLHALTGEGLPVAGFPVEGGGAWASAPACADLDGDNRPELVWAGSDGVVRAVDGTGRVVPGFPLKDLRAAEGMLAVGDLHVSPGVEIVVGAVDGRVHVLGRKTGKGAFASVEGFPVKTQFTVSGGPALADLDADATLDLAFGSQDFSIHALRGDGSHLPGFPQQTSYRIYAQPALADLTGDGKREVVVGGADGNVYAFQPDGTPAPGWPVKLGGRINACAAVGDLDGDGSQEVVVASAEGRLHVLRANGTPVGGFPETPGGALQSAPVIVDLDGDGRIEVIVGGAAGKLHAYSFANLGKVKRPYIAWPTAGHDAGRVSRVRPNAAMFLGVAVAPDAARTEDELTVRYRFVDLDGDAEKDTQVRWYLDGQLVTELNNKRAVPRERTAKRQRWSYTLQEGADFQAQGEGKGATIWRSNELTVANTAPTAPVVGFKNQEPRTDDVLEVVITQPAQDADQDTLQYRFRWFRNREAVTDLPLSASTVDGTRTRKGERWRVVVTAFDGEVEGASGAADVTVLNTTPSAPGLVLDPAEPGAAVPVHAVIQKPSTDPDGDVITYEYAWSVNGGPVPLMKDRDTLPPYSVRKGQRITLVVTPRDDEAPGQTTTLETTVVNTPPRPAAVTVLPSGARTDDDLQASISAPAHDVDGDHVTYAFTWARDGQPLPATDPLTVPRDQTVKGQKFTLTALPSDGTRDGTHASGDLTVANTAPGGARAHLEPSEPRAGDTMKVVIDQPAPDADGDAVSYRIRWLRDGKDETARAKGEALPAGIIRKGEVWQAVVTAFDGVATGTPVSTDEKRVLDTPPTSPTVAVRAKGSSGTAVGTEDVLVVQVVKPATDVDKDAVSYRYRWFVDGMLQDVPDTQDAIPAARTERGQTWRVEVTPVADGRRGTPVTSEVTVGNTPPKAPPLSIFPAKPLAGQSLRVSMGRAPEDADGDPVRLTFRWLRNGSPAGVEGAVVPAGRTRKGETWTAVATPADDNGDGAPTQVAVMVGNTPPAPPRIQVTPLSPRTTNVVEVQVLQPASDVDGDAVKLGYTWFVDGAEAKALAGKTRLAKGEFKKNQRLRVEVTPSDGTASGAKVVAEIRSVNSAPSAPQVRLQPADVAVPGPLKVEMTAPAQDPDGDGLTYRHRFYRNGTLLTLPPTTTAVPKEMLRRGDAWRVEVVAYDGETEGPAGSAEALVVNAAPSSPKVRFVHDTVTVAGPLDVEITTPAVDADEDTLQYQHRFRRNGQVVDLPSWRSGVPRTLLKKGDKWSVDVVATDGQLRSAPATAEAKVVNTPPTAPVVRFSAQRNGSQPLKVELVAPAHDVDGDTLTYRYRYTRAGGAVKLDPKTDTIPVTMLRAGEKWQVTVVAFDGEKEGPVASAEAVIQPPNTPPVEEAAPAIPAPPVLPSETEPTAPAPPDPATQAPPPSRPAVCRAQGPTENALPRAGEALRVVFGTDAVSQAAAAGTVQWLRDGQDAVRGNEVPPGTVRKRERWQPVVTTSDGKTVRCRELTVGDTPPGAPAVTLTPTGPRAGQPLTAEVVAPGSDVDGDAVSVRFRWFLDGVPQDIPERDAVVAGARVRKGQRWRVQAVSVADGAEGASAGAEVTVGNTPPAPLEIVVTPAQPLPGQELEVNLARPADDVDGDPVALRFQWIVNGQDAGIAEPRVPARRLKKGEVWQVWVIGSDGEVETPPAGAKVTVRNALPTPPVVSLGESRIRAGSAVEVKQLRAAADSDGDKVTVSYTWWVDGKEVPAFKGRTRLEPTELKKNQRIRLVATPHDGAEAGPSVHAEVQVLNTPPTAPAIRFNKEQLPVTEALKVELTRPATDADGDTLTYRYRFLRNGVRVKLPESESAVPAAMMKKNERWRVEVVAFDGEEEGPAVWAEAVVINTPPRAPVLAVTPREPLTTNTLTCAVTSPAQDVDGDVVTYRTRWLRNGQPVPLVDGDRLSPEATHRGEKWSCTAAAHDGEALGAWGNAGEVTVLNTAPQAPQVGVVPRAPKVGEPLSCRVASEARDHDGDPPRYTFRWEKNGRPVAKLDGALEVPGAEVRRGDRWGCWAQAADDARSGEPGPRTEVAVGNTPPSAPVVEVLPASPRPGDPLRCEVRQVSVDPDGDRVSYRVVWEKDGVQQSFASTEVQVAGRLVMAGQTWRCILTASDGRLDSPPGRSPPVSVQPTGSPAASR